MVTVACKTVTALNRPVSAASLAFIMVTITISVAVGRLILNVLTVGSQLYSAYATIPLQLLTELETFFAAVVNCLPSLRVFLRTKGGRGREALFGGDFVMTPDYEMDAAVGVGGGGVRKFDCSSGTARQGGMP